MSYYRDNLNQIMFCSKVYVKTIYSTTYIFQPHIVYYFHQAQKCLAVWATRVLKLLSVCLQTVRKQTVFISLLALWLWSQEVKRY